MSFKGNYRDCLSEWSSKILPPKGSHDALKFKMPLAEFCGVTTQAVTRWLRRPPAALERVKLWMFFRDICGFQVEELALLDKMPDHLHLAEMLGYRVLSPDVAMRHLNFTVSHHVYRLVNGGGTGQDREFAIQGLWEELEEKVLAARVHWKERFLSQPKYVQLRNGSERIVPSESHRSVVHALAGLMNSALPLINLVASAEFSEEDRIQLRGLTSPMTLYAAVYRLLAEREKAALGGGGRRRS